MALKARGIDIEGFVPIPLAQILVSLPVGDSFLALPSSLELCASFLKSRMLMEPSDPLPISSRSQPCRSPADPGIRGRELQPRRLDFDARLPLAKGRESTIGPSGDETDWTRDHHSLRTSFYNLEQQV
jgi:hypothetical protein